MKSLPRILFVLFVIGLIGFSIYTIYKNDKKEETDEEIKTSEIIPQIVNDMRLGIAEFDTMNPILSKNQNVQDIAKIIYEPLVNLGADYKLEPCLATEWSKIESNCYLIKLREGVKWHDGTDFTSKDVKFTIDKIKSEEVSSIYEKNIINVVKLDIIDNYTIKLTLDSDVPFFEYNLIFPILSENYYAGQDFLTTSKNRNPVGTGKFKVYAEEDGSLTLNKNKDYWNKKQDSLGYEIKTIHVYMYSSMGEVYNGFKIGNIDMVSSNNLYMENYIGTIGYSKKEFKGKNFDFLALNTENDVLSHVEVRKAISYAIDKSRIISEIYNNKCYSAEFPLDYDNWIYKSESSSSGYNPSQVDVIMNENGWNLKNSVWNKTENYKTIRTNLTMVVRASNEERVKVAEIIKEQLANVGIVVNIIRATDAQYQSYLNNKDYDMILTGTQIGFTPSIETYLGAGNLSKYYNGEINGLLGEARKTTDEGKIVEKYKRIYEIYHQEVPFISLYFNKVTLCYSPNLMGEITPNNFNLFYNIDRWYRQY